MSCSHFRYEKPEIFFFVTQFVRLNHSDPIYFEFIQQTYHTRDYRTFVEKMFESVYDCFMRENNS